jgi:hypothetical protein
MDNGFCTDREKTERSEKCSKLKAKLKFFSFFPHNFFDNFSVCEKFILKSFADVGVNVTDDTMSYTPGVSGSF